MRFLLDAQLPPGLAMRLTAVGQDSAHVTTDLPGEASDREVADLAAEQNAVLMSQDADFLHMSLVGTLTVQLVWIRAGNMTTRQLLTLLEPLLPELVAALEQGQGVVEIR